MLNQPSGWQVGNPAFGFGSEDPPGEVVSTNEIRMLIYNKRNKRYLNFLILNDFRPEL